MCLFQRPFIRYFQLGQKDILIFQQQFLPLCEGLLSHISSVLGFAHLVVSPGQRHRPQGFCIAPVTNALQLRGTQAVKYVLARSAFTGRSPHLFCQFLNGSRYEYKIGYNCCFENRFAFSFTCRFHWCRDRSACSYHLFYYSFHSSSLSLSSMSVCYNYYYFSHNYYHDYYCYYY